MTDKKVGTVGESLDKKVDLLGSKTTPILLDDNKRCSMGPVKIDTQSRLRYSEAKKLKPTDPDYPKDSMSLADHVVTLK